MTKKVWINSKNGRISALLNEPAQESGEKYTIAIILHGIGDHKDTPFMHAIATGLENRNIATLRIDFDGHGESEGTFTDMTISKEVDDAIAAVEYAKQLKGVGKIVLVGHSQGGVVASLTAGKLGNKIDGLELLAPAYVLKDGANNGNILGGEFDTANLPETLPIVWGVLGKNYITDAQQLAIYETVEQYGGPIDIIHGSDDVVAPISYSEELNKKLKNSRLNVLQGYAHSFEPNSDLCVKLTGDFIEKKITGKGDTLKKAS